MNFGNADGKGRGARGLEKLLGVYTYAVSFPRAGRIDLPTYTLCNRRVTDVGYVSYKQSSHVRHATAGPNLGGKKSR